MAANRNRLVLGIPSRKQSLYSRSALELLEANGVETHVILPSNPRSEFESSHVPLEFITEKATATYAEENIGAPMASGSWPSSGLLILPSSAEMLRRIALGYSSNLFTRTADVMLKERRTLVTVPFSPEWDAKLTDNMLTVTEAGGTIFPPFPSFYTGIQDTERMVERIVARALSLFDIVTELEEWRGI